MRYHLIPLLLAALFCTCCTPPQTPPATAPAADTSAAVVLSETVALVRFVKDGEQVPAFTPNATEKPYCAGVWLTPSRFLTAAHCVDSVGQQVEWTDYGHYTTFDEGKVVKRDPVVDLALIDTPLLSAQTLSLLGRHYAPIATALPPIGSEVHIVGHTGGQWWTYQVDYFSALRPADEDTPEVLQIEGPVYFGNSGGGVFTPDGKLLGIASFIRLATPGFGYYISLDTIRVFIASSS